MTITNPKKSKSLVLFVSLLITIAVVLIIILVLKDYNKPKPVVNNTNNNNQQNNNSELQSVITDQNEYINYEYNFGLSFPDYWEGFKAVEKDRTVEFSLENQNKEYIPIFTIGTYYSDEFKSSPDPKPIAIDTKGDLTVAYLMKRNDQNLSEFGEIYSENGYMKPYFDVRNNIIPTFKFIKKGDVFDEKNKFQKDNEFKLIEAKVGSKVADMTIKSTNAFPDGGLLIDELLIKFSGEATITGTYHNDKVDSQTGFGGQVCFDDLDEQSKDKIPSVVWNDRYIRFCFINQELAREIFKPEGSTGIATIIIDDYVINEGMARLVKVVNKD